MFYMAADNPNRDNFEPALVEGWYHTDETDSDTYGPFATKEHALDELERYCNWLNRSQDQV